MSDWPTIVEDGFRQILRELREAALKGDDDFHIIVDGIEGIGKSTLSLAIAKEIDPTFSPEKTMYSETRQLPQLLVNVGVMPPGTVHIVDEAQNFFHRRRHQTWINITLDEVIKTIRARKQIMIYNTPAFWDLDVIPRRAKMIIHVVSRGEAMVFFGNFKKRLLEAMEELRRKKKVSTFEDILAYWKEEGGRIGKMDYLVIHWEGGQPKEYVKHKEYTTVRFLVWKALEAMEKFNAPFHIPDHILEDEELLEVVKNTIEEYNSFKKAKGEKVIKIDLLGLESEEEEELEQYEYIVDRMQEVI